MKLPVLIYYLHTSDSGEELRMALRSLQNISNWDGRAFIVGDRERWFSDNIIYIACKQIHGSPYEDAERKMMTALQDKRLPDDFILSNDDIYTTEKVEVKPLHKGEILGGEKNYYQRSKLFTKKWLIDQGVEKPLDYSLHVPMIMNRQKRMKVHNLTRHKLRGITLQARNVYGNLFIDPKDAEFYEDQKTKTGNLKEGVYISTQFYTNELEGLFPNKSKFEI